jgi:hypothetical protein
MPDVLSSLASMGISTAQELQALILLFNHQQRPNEALQAYRGSELVDARGEVNFTATDTDRTILPRAAENLMNGNKDAATGIATGTRNVRPNLRRSY